MSQLLKDVGIKRLTLRFAAAPDLSDLPWASLEVLKFDMSKFIEIEDIDRVTEQLQQQVHVPFSSATTFKN